MNNSNIKTMTETAQRCFEAAHSIIENMNVWERKQIKELAEEIYKKFEKSKHFPTSYDHPYENELTKKRVKKECLEFAAKIYWVWGRMSKWYLKNC